MCKIGFILISQVHKYKNLHLFKLIQTCFIYCYKYFDQILYAELFFLRKVVTVTTALESNTSNLAKYTYISMEIKKGTYQPSVKLPVVVALILRPVILLELREGY